MKLAARYSRKEWAIVNVAQINDITIQQMQIFVIAAQQKNFSLAAEALFLTQPSVSKWIAKLERQLDCKLFLRHGSGVELTRTGEILLCQWQKILFDFNTSIEAVRQAALSPEVLRIGCMSQLKRNQSILSYLNHYGKRFPDVEIIVEAYEQKQLHEDLLKGKFDAIFSYSYDFVENDLVQMQYLYKASLFLVGTRAAMEDKASAGYHTLLLLSHSQSQYGSDRAMDVCRRMGYAYQRIKYYPNIASIELAMRQGKGVMICGDYIFNDCDELLRFPVPGDYISNYVSLIWLTETDKPCVMNFTAGPPEKTSRKNDKKTLDKETVF